MLPALAFLQADDAIEGFEELTDTIRILYDDVADDLLQYFEDTYMGRYRRNAPRRPALFAIILWNIFSRTDDELPHANNSVEGRHRSFKGHVSACHPVFRKFLSVLQQQENRFVSRLSSTMRDSQHHHQGNVIWIQAEEYL